MWSKHSAYVLDIKLYFYQKMILESDFMQLHWIYVRFYEPLIIIGIRMATSPWAIVITYVQHSPDLSLYYIISTLHSTLHSTQIAKSQKFDINMH